MENSTAFLMGLMIGFSINQVRVWRVKDRLKKIAEFEKMS